MCDLVGATAAAVTAMAFDPATRRSSVIGHDPDAFPVHPTDVVIPTRMLEHGSASAVSDAWIGVNDVIRGRKEEGVRTGVGGAECV